MQSMLEQDFKNRFIKHIEKIMITKTKFTLLFNRLSFTMKLSFDFTNKKF